MFVFLSGSSATQLSFATSFMPSHDDISVDSLATFSDLDLNLEGTPRTVHDIEDFSDDSDVANDIGIDFQTTHFNGDESSSDEEKLYSEDLKFPDTVDTGTNRNVVLASSSQHVIPDNQQASIVNFISSNLIGLTSKIGQTYNLTNVLMRGSGDSSKTESMVKNNSSDSLGSEDDFEIVSHEDVS